MTIDLLVELECIAVSYNIYRVVIFSICFLCRIELSCECDVAGFGVCAVKLYCVLACCQFIFQIGLTLSYISFGSRAAFGRADAACEIFTGERYPIE